MTKKFLIVFFSAIVLCLCCGMCFAAQDKSVNLGNEIMDSIDKTGHSFNNVVSGNVVKDAGNMINNEGRRINNGVNNVENGLRDTGANIRDDRNNIANDRTNGNYNNYNTVRTTAEGTRTATANVMSTTTWMWIILVVAAIIIIAAIWYYATQNND